MDYGYECSYNSSMRRLRKDRNHVIYQITCTETDDFYIGVTVAKGHAYLKSVKLRFQNHMSAARCGSKDWVFAEFLRKNEEAEYEYEVLEIVRGRKNAHQRERELIAIYEPTLNTK